MAKRRAREHRTGSGDAPSRVPGSRPGVRVSWWATRPALVALGLAAVLTIGGGLAYRLWTSRPPPPGAAAPAGRDNVLLITLDTVRADHLGSYGHPRARTRHLDRLAAEGVRFEWAFSPAPITLPAHASILTGLYPFEHGVRNNGNFYLGDTFDTLATVLAGQGYRTAAFVSAFVLDRRYGLGRGFQLYDDRMQGGQPQVLSLEAERRGDHTAEAMVRWLEGYAAETGGASAPGRPPFFVWLHLYDPHEPYRPPQPFRDAFSDAPYDGEIAFDDSVVAYVRDRLGQLGLLDRTVIAIIGDHGESLGDHGEETHTMFVYDSAIRVPLILWRPGRIPAGTAVPDVVRATDVAPTLLELVGAPPLRIAHGRSLVPILTGQSAPDAPAVYAETYLPKFYMNWAPLTTLRDERWKFIDAPRPELYDLQADPGETRNLFDSQRRTAEAMRAALARLTGGSEGSMAAGGLDREAMEKLAALGYIGAGASPPPAAAGSAGADPKDVIAIFNRLRRANSAVRDRRFAEALPILEQVLRDDPRNAFAQLVLGSAYMGMEKYRPAIVQYRKYLALVPTSAYAHLWMAICLVRLGDQDGTLRETAAALAIDPKFSDARILRAGVLASRGRYAEAIADLRAAVESDPAKPMVRLDLAKVLAEAGRRDEAREQYGAILTLQPDFAAALNGLGTLEAGSGNLDQAVALFRRSLAVEPRQADARFNLGRALEQQGRRDDALGEFSRVADDPAAAPAVRAAARERAAAIRGVPGR
jgi:arylsulfatase A-like enzyme/Tfp pilus assembly protein PilF